MDIYIYEYMDMCRHITHCTMVTDNSTKILIAFIYIVTITETYQKTVTNNSTQELFLYMYIL